MSEESDALLHIADDHSCCKPTLLWAHNRLLELERENAALREDKARLDYIDSLSPGDGWSIYRTSATKNAELVAGDPRTIRKLAGIRFAIDAARKEAQP